MQKCLVLTHNCWSVASKYAPWLPLKTWQMILGLLVNGKSSWVKVSRTKFWMGIKACNPFFNLTYLAWRALRQILDISCDFQIRGTLPNITMYLYLDLTDYGFLSGSLPHNPAKSASTQHLRSNVPSGFMSRPLFGSHAKYLTIDLIAFACDTFGPAVNHATWLTANVMSGLVLFDTYNNIPTTLA